jgi:hypothetical protein
LMTRDSAAIAAARARGIGIRRIVREIGVGVGTVLRVTGEGRLTCKGNLVWMPVTGPHSNTDSAPPPRRKITEL